MVKRCHGYVYFSIVLALAAVLVAGSCYAQDEDSTRNILKQGLLGAGTGAIAAGTSGGNAGKGALIGAGTNVIGGALLDALTTPSSSSRSSSRRRSAPPPPPEEEYYDDQGDEYYYEEPPQESGSQKVLKQGLLGAGTGAIAASASGGDAGKGALIGAGTNVIGGALLDTLTQPSQPRRVYRRAAPRAQYPAQPQAYQQQPPQQQVQQVQQTTENTDVGTHKKIVRKYDENGKVVSEEEIFY
jgi:L-aminopeptidase/D-esterase-like protein